MNGYQEFKQDVKRWVRWIWAGFVVGLIICVIVMALAWFYG